MNVIDSSVYLTFDNQFRLVFSQQQNGGRTITLQQVSLRKIIVDSHVKKLNKYDRFCFVVFFFYRYSKT